MANQKAMNEAQRAQPTILEEFVMAKVIANKVLDRINADPDDDLAILARQFLRAVERSQAAYAAGAADAYEDCIGLADRYKFSNSRLVAAIRARQEQGKEKP